LVLESTVIKRNAVMNYVQDIKNTECSYREKKIEIQSLRSLPLKEKIKYSERIIKKILEMQHRPVVAWSGGKDSTALLYLVLREEPKIDVVWVNTGVEYPECVKFIRQLASNWTINIHIAKPATTFWKVVDKYGYPFFGKGNGSGYWYNRVDLWNRRGHGELARTIEVAKASNECCRILKENPAKKLYRELNTDCVILGNIVAESHQRFLTWIRKGDYFYSTSEGRWKVWPLSIWTDDDIWEFHKLNMIPHSSIYDKGHRRNGCWPCLMDLKFKDNHLSALRQSHPKLWHFLVEEKEIGEIILALKLGLSRKEMDEEYEKLRKDVRHFIRTNPCFFDAI
jgi:3'-phosphoadenosine 5'-phosphosulfate sulfotransferase (PAPS reductase)/FAD synthetase